MGRPLNNHRVRWQRSTPYNNPLLYCHPERTRISCFTALNSTTYVVLPKENHMQLTEAATLDWKSGGAEGSAVLRTFPENVSPERRDLRFFHFDARLGYSLAGFFPEIDLAFLRVAINLL
jgi:hypothetical protein